ncbi:MAG: hypothetical protein ABSA96_05350 [Candidatus Acidiferrales bacterium]|jgi:hypothetical protein
MLNVPAAKVKQGVQGDQNPWVYGPVNEIAKAVWRQQSAGRTL